MNSHQTGIAFKFFPDISFHIGEKSKDQKRGNLGNPQVRFKTSNTCLVLINLGEILLLFFQMLIQ